MPTSKKTTPSSSLIPFPSTETGTEANQSLDNDEAVLDEFEQLERDCILDESDGDDPGEADEKKILPVDKLPPRFSNFRSNPATVLELWGTSDQQGMDTLVYVTTRTFAPSFDDDVDLRRVRFYETVTAGDNVVRLVYCFVPEAGSRKPNLWITSKKAALDQSLTQWTTVRSRKKLQQYTYRVSRKDKDYGEPTFSGLTKGQLLAELKQQGILILDKKHPFFLLATDTEDAEDAGR
jgi:hypothetical protein